MLIREYKGQDEKDLLQLIVYLQDYMKSKEPEILDSGENIGEEFLRNLVSETKGSMGKIYVAEEENEVVGFVSGRVEQSTDEIELIEKKVFYISNLVVLPKFQKHGIGKALLAKVEDYAKSLNLKLIQINVLVKNEIAYKTYKNAGFRDYEMVLLKKSF